MSNLADVDIDGLGKVTPPPQEGWYHAKLVACKPDCNNKGDYYRCTWQLVGATPELQGERGKYVYETYYAYSSVFVKQIATIGVALGIYTKDYLKTLKEKGADLPMPDFESWFGASCLVKVKHEKDRNDPKKIYARIGFDYVPVNSDIAAETGVIFDKASLKNGVQVQPTNKADEDF